MAAQARAVAADTRSGSRPAPRSSRAGRPLSHLSAPAYASILGTARKVEGAIVTDARGASRIDLRNGDGSVLLGWGDPLVEAAVARTPSVCSGRLEAEAAERVGELIPSAEAVGFRSSLEAALVDALVAAKTITGRDGAFFCDDETATSGDVDTLRDALDRHLGVLAALIVRPMDVPRDFLLAARRLTDRAGVVLVFDESRTALRLDLGGAQTLAGVMPDLTLLGSSLANGRQIAAVAGRMQPMTAMTATGDRVSAASLAATCATLDRVVRDDVPDVLRVRGAEIEAEVDAKLRDTGADQLFEIVGDPTWSLISAIAGPDLDGEALEAALTASLYAEGVLSCGAHIPSMATRDEVVADLLRAYDVVLPALVARAGEGQFPRPRSRSAA